MRIRAAISLFLLCALLPSQGVSTSVMPPNKERTVFEAQCSHTSVSVSIEEVLDPYPSQIILKSIEVNGRPDNEVTAQTEKLLEGMTNLFSVHGACDIRRMIVTFIGRAKPDPKQEKVKRGNLIDVAAVIELNEGKFLRVRRNQIEPRPIRVIRD